MKAYRVISVERIENMEDILAYKQSEVALCFSKDDADRLAAFQRRKCFIEEIEVESF